MINLKDFVLVVPTISAKTSTTMRMRIVDCRKITLTKAARIKLGCIEKGVSVRLYVSADGKQVVIDPKELSTSYATVTVRKSGDINCSQLAKELTARGISFPADYIGEEDPDDGVILFKLQEALQLSPQAAKRSAGRPRKKNLDSLMPKGGRA